MGVEYALHCAACGYHNPHCCAGMEAGMAVTLSTVHCATCKQLYDVPVFEHGHSFSEIPMRCPTYEAHAVVAWSHPGPQSAAGSHEVDPALSVNCIDFCVRVEPRRITRPLTPAELADGYNYINRSVVSGGLKVKISPEGSADNGDGKTRINSDRNVSTEVADMLGYKSVKIKAGTYTIDYSTLTYSSILMDAVVVPK